MVTEHDEMMFMVFKHNTNGITINFIQNSANIEMEIFILQTKDKKKLILFMEFLV